MQSYKKQFNSHAVEKESIQQEIELLERLVDLETKYYDEKNTNYYKNPENESEHVPIDFFKSYIREQKLSREITKIHFSDYHEKQKAKLAKKENAEEKKIDGNEQLLLIKKELIKFYGFSKNTFDVEIKNQYSYYHKICNQSYL